MSNKSEYLARTLSRTKRKDYENYVINRLYNRLDDLEIKPVTQQYVKRKCGNSNYALIDLYFPQLNIGIEINEAHHLIQKEEDKLRFDDILNSINSYSQIKIDIFKKINGKTVVRSIDDINNDIDDAVKKIKQKKATLGNSFIVWDGKPDICKALQKGSISISDNYIFNQEEVRKFFGKNGKTQLSFYKIDNNGDHLWLPGLAIENNGEYIPYSKRLKYLNILSSDGEFIYELIVDAVRVVKENFNRIVFAKMKDNILNRQVYKFIGIFQKQEETIFLDINGKKQEFVVHKRIGEEIEK